MAFNTKDGHLYPFPIAKPGLFRTNALTEESIRHFSQAFLRGEARLSAPGAKPAAAADAGGVGEVG